MSKNDDAWQRYIDAKRIAFDQPSYVIEAEELARIAQREPRLLAKFDTPSDLPKPLRDVGYTLVPIRNGRYLLVHGNLFFAPPPCTDKIAFEPNLLFPLQTASRGQSESQHVDYAFNLGILTEFMGLGPMYSMIRGREYTKPFQYRLSNVDIQAESVQIEVDAGYEALYDLILVEVKIGLPTYFNIRQLYYPFRHFSKIIPNKRVRTLFLTYNAPTSSYYVYEYAFPEESNPLSAQVTRCAIYSLTSAEPMEIHDLLDVRFQTRNNIVPQADDLNKVLQLLTLIDVGLNTVSDIAVYFEFNPRQSSYYREAAEYLGLVTTVASGSYKLTTLGENLLSQQPSNQSQTFARVVVNSWIFVELIQRAIKGGKFTEANITTIISNVRTANGIQRYNNTTIGRRQRTILSWLNWLTDEIGCFTRVDGGYRLR